MLLRHERRGAGEPLLLIHGTGGFLRVWDPVVERLAAERDVVALDLPGFGASASLPAGTRHGAREFAAAVAGFMDAIGLETAHLAGNSLGGWVALELAKRGRARTVTGLSPAGFWTPWEAAYCRASLRGVLLLAPIRPLLRAIDATAAGRTALAAQLIGRPGRWPPEAMLAAQHNLLDSPAYLPTVRDALSERFYGGDEVKVPVTIAWAERDRLLFPRQARIAARDLPHARLVTLTGCGHVPTWDDPDQVARVLLEGSAPV